MEAKPGIQTPLGRTSPFVGREADLAALRGWLERAQAGSGGLVMIGGEPGLGKTRICEEIAAEARARGFFVSVGHCYEMEGGPPYTPFLEALEQIVGSVDDAQLRQSLGDSASELAAFLSAVKRRLPDAPAAPALSPIERRRTLFDAIGRFLSFRSQQQPLLLILEDLHWCDESSFALLQYIASRLQDFSGLVLGTYRDTEVDALHPLSQVLQDVGRRRVGADLLLHRLPPEAVAALLATHGKGTPPTRLVAMVEQETDGNPFFIEEVIRHLEEEGKLVDIGGAWLSMVSVSEVEVPRTVRLVIERRLARLSDGCKTLLTSAGVVGRNFDYAIIEALCGPSALECVEEAQRAHLVREISTDRDVCLTFSHELVRQTLLAGLSTPRRQRLHLEVAQTIKALYPDYRDDHLAMLAYHLQAAGTSADTDETVEYLALAADRAVTLTAYDEAIQLYETALKLVATMPANEERRHLEADLHAKAGAIYAGIGRWPGAKQELRAALAAHKERDERRAELLEQLASASFWGLDTLGAHEAAAELAGLAEHVARPDLVVAAIGWDGIADATAGQQELSETKLRRALNLARELKVPPPTTTLWQMGLSSYWRGDLAKSNEMNIAAASAARQQGDPTMLVLTLPQLGLSLAASGRYAEAEAIFRQSLETGRRYNIETPYARAVAMSAGYHMDLFDYAGAERINRDAQELSRSFDVVPPLISATLDLMFLGARRGEPDSGTALLAEVTEAIERAGGWNGWLWRLRLTQVQTEVAFARGDYQAALDLSQSGFEGSQKHGRRRYQTMALVTRAQALNGLGRAREALGVLQSAAAIARELGDPALLLRCLSCLLVIEPDGLLLDEARSAVQRVVDNLDDDELRQTFLSSEGVRLLGKLSAAGAFDAVRRPKTPDVLSVRQLEVLRLLAAGKTNHEIADRLVLSERTVQRHISDIYAKIDVRNRAEATAYALGNPAIL